jgi:hypothetical protein
MTLAQQVDLGGQQGNIVRVIHLLGWRGPDSVHAVTMG